MPYFSAPYSAVSTHMLSPALPSHVFLLDEPVMAVRERSGSKRGNLRGYLIASRPLSAHLLGAFLPDFDCHKQEVQHPLGRHAPNVLPGFCRAHLLFPQYKGTTPSPTNFPQAPHLSSKPNQHGQLFRQLAIEVDKVSQRKRKRGKNVFH